MAESNKQPNLEFIQKVGIAAMKNSFATHERLGASGIEMVHKNQFGDTAMKGDIEAEAAVLAVLKENNFPVVVYSEEHGKVSITEEPKYLAVLDGIDGSAWYKKEQGVGRYGTLLGIFAGTNPTYSDYLFSGIMEHATKRLFYAVKGIGSFVLDIKTDQAVPIKTSASTRLDIQTVIHIDQYWDINKEVFLAKLNDYNVQEYTQCSSYHYSNVADGSADLTLECTRKGNLEIAALYGLIHEAGGTMVNLQGEKIAEMKYLEFGQEEHLPVITAATEKLAREAVAFFGKTY